MHAWAHRPEKRGQGTRRWETKSTRVARLIEATQDTPSKMFAALTSRCRIGGFEVLESLECKYARPLAAPTMTPSRCCHVSISPRRAHPTESCEPEVPAGRRRRMRSSRLPPIIRGKTRQTDCERADQTDDEREEGLVQGRGFSSGEGRPDRS